MEKATPKDFAGIIAEGVAHVWIVPLDGVGMALDAGALGLSAEELARAARQRDAPARARFVLSRAILRRVLGATLGRPAAELAFIRGERGKPAVAAAAGIDFSFTDCRDVAVIAVAACATGVDAEHDRPLRRAGRTARRIFHPDTVAVLERLRPELRARAFLDAWTLREAHVKAIGGGLLHTPDALPFDPHMPADRRLRTVDHRFTGQPWSVARFTPSASTRAAVVFGGAVQTLHIHEGDVALRFLEEEMR
jgi:4'-phosphopantetheinyl transferase